MVSNGAHPTPVTGYASIVLDDKIYIIRGGTGTAVIAASSNLEKIVVPKKNQWTNGTSLPTSVPYANACATTGQFAPKRIYVIGGAPEYDIGISYIATAMNQVYYPETGLWQRLYLLLEMIQLS